MMRPGGDDTPQRARPGARTTVVSVCFRSGAVLPAMLASLPPATPVVLVDNAGCDATAAIAAAAGARLLRNERNLGFGVACNQGAALAGTEFLLFLNPDAALGPGAIAALEAAADAHADAVAFNPRIADARGRPAFKRASPLLRTRLARGWPAAPRVVPVLSGAAFFVRRAAFERLGGFDPAIFLYHEDDDLSLRLARLGALRFVPDALATHQGGRSSARTAEVAALKAWHMGRSRVHAMRKHGRRAAFARSLAVALWQLASPAVLVSARKRAKQRAFLAGIWSMRA